MSSDVTACVDSLIWNPCLATQVWSLTRSNEGVQGVFETTPHLASYSYDQKPPPRSFSSPPHAPSVTETMQQTMTFTEGSDTLSFSPLQKCSRSPDSSSFKSPAPTPADYPVLMQRTRIRTGNQSQEESHPSSSCGPRVTSEHATAMRGVAASAAAGDKLHHNLNRPVPLRLPARTATTHEWDMHAESHGNMAVGSLQSVDAARLQSVSPISAVYQRSMSASSQPQQQLSLHYATCVAVGRDRVATGLQVHSGVGVQGGVPTFSPWISQRSNTASSHVASPMRIHGRSSFGQPDYIGTPPLRASSPPLDVSAGNSARDQADSPSPTEHWYRGASHRIALDQLGSQCADLLDSAEELPVARLAAAMPPHTRQHSQVHTQAIRLRALSHDSAGEMACFQSCRGAQSACMQGAVLPSRLGSDCASASTSQQATQEQQYQAAGQEQAEWFDRQLWLKCEACHCIPEVTASNETPLGGDSAPVMLISVDSSSESGIHV